MRHHLKPLSALIALLVLLALAAPVLAQIDPGTYVLRQNDVVVGQIYVPARSAEDCKYREYWYLHKDYVYPSSEGSLGFTLEPVEAGTAASSFEEFLAEVEADHPGGRLILVDSTELREGC